MARAAGFATGLFIGLWGVTFLWVDKLVLFEPPQDDAGIRGMLAQQQVAEETRPVVDPAAWAACALLSTE